MTNDKSGTEKIGTMKINIKNHSIIFFCVLSYVISWTLWVISGLSGAEIFDVAGRFGPLVSAIIICSITDGKTGVKQLFSKSYVKGVSAKWYIYSLLGPAAIVFPAIYINQLITGIKPVFNDPREWYLIIIAFLYVLFLSVLGEETGWRGFALPRLLKRFNALTAGLIIGVVWAMWHLPLFLIEGDFHGMIPF